MDRFLCHVAREIFIRDFLKGKFVYEEGGPEHRPPETGTIAKIEGPLGFKEGIKPGDTGPEKKETLLPGAGEGAEARVDEQDAAARRKAELAANKAKALIAKLFPKSGGATKDLLASTSTTEELNAAFEGVSAQQPPTATASLELKGADTGTVATIGPIGGTTLGAEAPPSAPPKVAKKSRGREGKKA